MDEIRVDGNKLYVQGSHTVLAVTDLLKQNWNPVPVIGNGERTGPQFCEGLAPDTGLEQENLMRIIKDATLTGDYYHYVEKLHCLRGERKKSVYRIGDAVTVRVDRVDTVRKRIDFSLVEEE